MLERTLDADLPVAWVTGDTVYESSQSLRAGLEERRQAYALAVACKERVEVQGTNKRVDQVAHGLTREDWRELSAGTGSKGPRLFAWTRIELAAPEISGWQRWLLARRGLDEGTKPAEIAYMLVFAPTGTFLEEMVEAGRAHAGQWSSVLRKRKEKWVWMSTRVRSWHGWYRHVTLSMLALAFLAALRANGDEDALKKSLNRRARHQNQKQPTLVNHKCLLISQSWFFSALPKSGGFSFIL